MLSTTQLLVDQEAKFKKSQELETWCKKLSDYDFSDMTVTAITQLLEFQFPLNQEIFKFVLMALQKIPSEYPSKIHAMFEALKNHPDLKNKAEVIYSSLDMLLSDSSHLTLKEIYPAHNKLINEIFFLNPEIYNNKEFLDKQLQWLMRFNIKDSFVNKILEYVNLSAFTTQELFDLLISICNMNMFNSEYLIDKVFATDQNLLEKTTPQQNYVLFKYALIKQHYPLADKVAAFEFDPNTPYEYDPRYHEITVKKENDSLLTLILKHSTPLHIRKYLNLVMKKGVDVFALDKYLFGHPISFILDNKLLDEISVYFADSHEKLLKAEHYLLIRALFYGTSDIKTKEHYQLFKESDWLSVTFINAFEKMLEGGIDLTKINQLYPGFLDWWLKNIVERTKDLSYFNELSAQDFFTFTSQIFSVPELAKQFSPYLARLEFVYFGDGGKTKDTWSQLAALVFKKSELYTKKEWSNLQPSLTPVFRKGKDDGEEKLPVKSLKIEHSMLPDIKSLTSLEMFADGENSWKFHTILGRTIQMTNAQGDILAIKLQKRKENLSELQKEYATANYLRKHAKLFKLQSSIHKPEAIVSIDNARKLLLADAELNPIQLTTLNQLVDLDQPICAYVYSVKQEASACFTYLHDITISDSEFNLANRIAINDLMQLFKYGFYYHQLADMFHADQETESDRYDGCRYRTLVNVINKTCYGKGEVDKWLKATDYLNLRKTGLVDLGDWVPVGDLFNPDNKFTFNNYCIPSTSMSAVLTYKPDKNIGNISTMNSIVEYLMVLELCVGRRGRMLTEKALSESASELHIKQLWIGLAQQMMNNTAQAIAIFCHVPEFKVYEILHSWVDVNQYAEQMEFWMTKKYIPYVDKDIPLPKSLYGEHVIAESVRSRLKQGTFNTQIGFSANGKDPDLGLMNSQHPIKAGDALMYIAAMMITTYLNQNEFDTEKLQKSIKALHEKNYAKAEMQLCSISGVYPQNPRLNTKAIKTINQNLPEDKSGERHLLEDKPGERYLLESSERHLLESNERHLLESGKQHLLESNEPHLLESGEQHLLESNERHLLESNEPHLLDSGEQHLLDSRDRYLLDGEQHLLESSEQHLLQSGKRYFLESSERHLLESGKRHFLKENPDELLETSLLKQKQIHIQQIEKYYGYRWLNMYKSKKAMKQNRELNEHLYYIPPSKPSS